MVGARCQLGRGVVDGEGLCTVTVEGASVGITYEIIVNTQQLMKVVNQGVELAKDDGKIEEVKEKIAVKMKERKEKKEREAAAAAAAAAAGTPPKPISPQKDEESERERFGSPTKDVDALGSALDRAFGASMFNNSEDVIFLAKKHGGYKYGEGYLGPGIIHRHTPANANKEHSVCKACGLRPGV